MVKRNEKLRFFVTKESLAFRVSGVHKCKYRSCNTGVQRTMFVPKFVPHNPSERVKNDNVEKIFEAYNGHWPTQLV